MNNFRLSHLGIAVTNTLSQFILRFITSLATLIATLSITYFLGLSVFGSFIKVTAFVSLFYLLIDFGINAVYLKNYPNQAEKLFFNLFSLRALISVILFFTIAMIILFLPFNSFTGSGFSNFEKIGILIFSLTFFTQSFSLSASAVFQKNFSYLFLILPNLIYLLLFTVFLMLGIFYKSFFLILFSYLIAGIIFSNLLYRLLKKKFEVELKLQNFATFAKELFRSSLPLGFILILNLIYFKIDTLILSLYKSSFDVGIYGFAYKIFEFVIAFPAFFANSIYPSLLRVENDNKRFYSHLKAYSYFLFFVSIIALIFLYFTSPLIRFFKKDLIFAVLPLRILAFSLPFFFLTALLQWVFVIKNKKNKLAIIYSLSLIINIILNLSFIPKFGYVAAAYSTLLCEGIILVWFLLSLSKIEKL